jgi:hypothetical protein
MTKKREEHNENGKEGVNAKRQLSHHGEGEKERRK